jgi:hypothetical protein
MDQEEMLDALMQHGVDDKWTMEELKMAKNLVEGYMFQLDEETASIKSQLSEAKHKAASTGNYSDNSWFRPWFRRANDAQRHRSRSRQKAQLVLGDVNRTIRKKNAIVGDNTPERRFITAAKRLLPEATYRAIWQEANLDQGTAELV